MSNNHAEQQQLTFVQPKADRAVVLEQVGRVPEPDYCIHGETRCYECNRWCWLGTETLALVESGKAIPLCIQCASTILQPGVALPILTVQDKEKGHGPA